jgi:hypothetical protein
VELTRQTYLPEEIAASSMEEAAAHVEARLDAPAVRIPDSNGLLLCPIARIVRCSIVEIEELTPEQRMARREKAKQLAEQLMPAGFTRRR